MPPASCPRMLERMQTERHETRRVGHAGHAEDAAFLAELVVVERIERMAEKLGFGVAHRQGPRQLAKTPTPRPGPSALT